MDTGPIYGRRRLEIGPTDMAEHLRGRLVAVGTDLLVETLRGTSAPVPQEGESTYADKIERDDLALDWKRPADDLHRVVRVGGAWTTIEGRLLKVHEVDLVDRTCRGRRRPRHPGRDDRGDGPRLPRPADGAAERAGPGSTPPPGAAARLGPTPAGT